ncbi:hypothetical protein NR798_47445 [Archangium gephyra]|uniref:hypothetical protein n=1 Tax=Archangium gephyra TaxID=48 RepID=UPI0035D49F55
MRLSVLGGLLATALMVGCGAPMEQEEGTELSTQEAQLPDCSTTGDTLRSYYRDASYTDLIGQRGCSCGMWMSWGTTSVYNQLTPEC